VRKPSPHPVRNVIELDKASKPAGLKEIAQHLGLSPASVSMVLNDAPLAKALTSETRARILNAAKEFNYRPNLMARGLSKRESRTVGVIASESSDGYYTRVMRGIEESLLDEGYLYFTVSHLMREELIREYPLLLKQRAVDGLVFLNTKIVQPPGIPAVTISYPASELGVTNIQVDQRLGTRLAVQHLHELGHKRILLMKGQSSCLESDDRWRLLVEAANEFGIKVDPALSLEMEHNQLTPELAFQKVSKLLRSGLNFTGVCAFNDSSAIGAMRALADFGKACPEDVSVIGFDDIGVANFYTPRLTTIRQPLEEMGRRTVELLIARIREPNRVHPEKLMLKPELIIRESTGPARTAASSKRIATLNK
jgi:DNA-binding LacI/PurR family transcriptional regulator